MWLSSVWFLENRGRASSPRSLCHGRGSNRRPRLHCRRSLQRWRDDDTESFLTERGRPAFQVTRPGQLCHRQHKATPLDRTGLLFTRTLYSSHSRRAKRYAAIKTGSILSPCPLHRVLEEAKPSAWFLLGPSAGDLLETEQRSNTVTARLRLFARVSQLAS